MSRECAMNRDSPAQFAHNFNERQYYVVNQDSKWCS